MRTAPAFVRHRRKARGAGAAQQLKQNGEGLILLMMAGEQNLAEFEMLGQRRVARLARLRLDVCIGIGINIKDRQIGRRLRRKLGHLPRPLIAICLQVMIDVHEAHVQISLTERMGKRQRIGTAGHRAHVALTRLTAQ